MVNQLIHIHEFSTGIQVDGDRYHWVSRGFTGDYMNKTIEPVPAAIHSAITNREFAVAEGASREKPAVIGREIEATNEQWSVVAVVTRGKDDRGRSASLYRYFCCEGLAHLTDILCWLKAQGDIFIFDPFDHQVVGQPHSYDPSLNPSPTDKILARLKWENWLDGKTPIIIPHDRPCVPLVLDAMANQIGRDDQPIAWAYNVEALQLPERFHVIQPASERAEKLLQKAKESAPKLSNVVAEEGQIKTALKGLSGREKPKPEQIEILESALSNPKIDDNYWKVLFDSQGAKDALNQGIYSAPMVRLLTLQAIVRPSSLPLFLDWMQKRDGQNDHYDISERFQLELARTLPNQAPQSWNRVTEGVRSLIPSLVQYPDIVEAIAWLLGLKNGLWGRVYQYLFRQELDEDLKNKGMMMKRSLHSLSNDNSLRVIGDRSWQPLWGDLDSAWKFRTFEPKPVYLSIARLFESLEDYDLCIFFYYLAQEIVPKEIFFQAKTRRIVKKVYGIDIHREIGNREKLWALIQKLWVLIQQTGGVIVPAYFVLFLIVIFTGLGFGGGYLVFHREIPPEPPVTNGSDDDQTIDMAKKSFGTTKISIAKITQELSSLKPRSQKEIEKQITTIIGSGTQYLSIEQMEQQKEKWIKAIIGYQKNSQFPSQDGVIDAGGQTYKKLKCDVAEKMQLTSKLPSCVPPASPNSKPTKKSTSSPQSQKPSPVTTPDPLAAKKSLGLKNFNTTKASLEKLRNDLLKETSLDVLEIETGIAETLSIGLDFQDMDKQKDAWIEAIINYQENVMKAQKDGIDGSISDNKNTYKVLKCDVADRLRKPLSQRPEICNTLLKSTNNQPPSGR